MVDAGKLRFGPHNAEVEKLLTWIDSEELLRFGKPSPGRSSLSAISRKH